MTDRFQNYRGSSRLSPLEKLKTDYFGLLEISSHHGRASKIMVSFLGVSLYSEASLKQLIPIPPHTQVVFHPFCCYFTMVQHYCHLSTRVQSLSSRRWEAFSELVVVAILQECTFSSDDSLQVASSCYFTCKMKS